MRMEDALRCFGLIVHVILLTVAVHSVTAQDYGERNDVVNKDKGSYSYGDYESVGDGEGETQRTTLCYVCHFERKQTDYVGTLDCDDPFTRSGIPQVACPGACGKRYYHIGNDYAIARMCMPKCTPEENEHGYIHCCYARLCNSSPSTLVANSSQLTMLLAASAVAFVLRWLAVVAL